MKIDACRICGNPITSVISFGNMPIVNYYLTQEEIQRPEKKYPLILCMCKNCTLAQLNVIINPEQIFNNYHYASSVSRPLQIHLEKLAELAIKRFKLTSNSSALDIGCNDGVLLSKLKHYTINVEGVDPAKNIVSQLKKINIPVIDTFFTYTLAKTLHLNGKRDIIFATNTLAQIVNLDDFMRGIRLLLKPNGIFIAEVGYLVDMLTKKTFDSIYHEHYSYFTLASLCYLFSKHQLQIFDAQRISNHGGSLRIFAQHQSTPSRKVTKRFTSLLHNEKTYQLGSISSYNDFVNYCTTYKETFFRLLSNIKKEKKIIIGVTSPAKGVILLNYCQIDHTIISFIVDTTPYKQNRYMPGVHIPIYPESCLEDTKADYLLLLAWTYKNELIKKLKIYQKRGVKLIIPLPHIKILSNR